MSACDSKSAAVDRCLADLLERRSAIEGLNFNDQVDEVSKIVARHSLELNRSRCSTLFAQLCVHSEGLHLDKDYPLAMAKGTLMEARLLSTAPKFVAASGDSLAAYVLGTLFLIAAAAGCPARFAYALSTGADGIAAKGHKKDCSPDNRLLRAVIHDMTVTDAASEDKICEADNSALQEGDSIVGEVKRVLEASFSGCDTSSQNNVFVAAFRIPVSAQFANVFIFVGNRLFLFRCGKADKDAVTEGFELWKMGSQTFKASKAFTKKYGDAQGKPSEELLARYNSPRSIVTRLIAAYHEVTGLRIDEVLPYFVIAASRPPKRAGAAAALSCDDSDDSSSAEVFHVRRGRAHWDVSMVPFQRVSNETIELLYARRCRTKLSDRLSDVELRELSNPPKPMPPASTTLAEPATKKHRVDHAKEGNASQPKTKKTNKK